MKKIQSIAIIAAMLLLLAQSILGVTSYFSAGSAPDMGQMNGQAPSMQMNESSDSSTSSTSDTTESTESTENSTATADSGFDPSQAQGNMPAMNGMNGPGTGAENKSVLELALSIAGLVVSVGGLVLMMLGWKKTKKQETTSIV
ncbi:hypothetical protein NDK25_04740 [Niallia taxi]|uniref:hypothetical protein n=1 Tax=Niallia taxi TaxID=2499688 RepID=UPI0023A99527|nr:hypothetical protein [Niallia taxi]MDE5051719.1 hypothetical protein [Niallia taxi]MED3964993.1 hypothetical protein [Niallia taxi]